MNNELNTRQWNLYNLLRNNPDKRFIQQEIINALYYDYPACDNDKPFHDTAARHLLTSDIRTINDNDTIQKIIISNGKGVKLASGKEFEQYIKSEYAQIFRRLKRANKKARKAGLDKQIKFTFGSERDTVEAFTDDLSRLKAARLAKGLKLIDVVRKLRKTEKGIDISLLSKMENGYCRPTQAQAAKLAQIYGIEPAKLTGDKVLSNDVIA